MERKTKLGVYQDLKSQYTFQVMEIGLKVNGLCNFIKYSYRPIRPVKGFLLRELKEYGNTLDKVWSNVPNEIVGYNHRREIFLLERGWISTIEVRERGEDIEGYLFWPEYDVESRIAYLDMRIKENT